MFLFLTPANIDVRCIKTLLLFQIQARIHCKSYTIPRKVDFLKSPFSWGFGVAAISRLRRSSHSLVVIKDSLVAIRSRLVSKSTRNVKMEINEQ